MNGRSPATARPAQDAQEARTAFFRGRRHRRYWWHRANGNDFLPAPYAALDDVEWGQLVEWFEDTEDRNLIGECSVPLISVLHGFVTGSGMSRLVQCGHYAGYSTLLLGFALRRMGRARALFTIDVDAGVTEYTRSWVLRAGLTDQVHLEIGDSADPEMPSRARAYLGGDIDAVLIDSSHQYAHTLKELELWYAALRPGGLLFLHDVSEHAAAFDATGQGGVFRALREWTAATGAPCLALNAAAPSLGAITYKDECGLGIVQKPFQDAGR